MIENWLIYGSPATVTEALAKVDAIGVGGVIMQFRLGPMSYDDVAQSLTLFMQKVAPELAGRGEVDQPVALSGCSLPRHATC